MIVVGFVHGNQNGNRQPAKTMRKSAADMTKAWLQAAVGRIGADKNPGPTEIELELQFAKLRCA